MELQAQTLLRPSKIKSVLVLNSVQKTTHSKKEAACHQPVPIECGRLKGGCDTPDSMVTITDTEV